MPKNHSTLSEAIILAGGLGTRLRSVVAEKPKALAPVAGRPFLEYLLDHLIAHGIRRCIFSVGYKAAHIQEQFGNQYRDLEIVYAHESEPLGTGGAIRNAMQFSQSEHLLVTNGDSLFLTDIQAQFQQHLNTDADVTLALRPMENFARYGEVKIDDNRQITAFKEKEPVEKGLINGGVYIFRKQDFMSIEFPQKFSVERDYFQALTAQKQFFGFSSHGYFLDIGIPSDFAKAQEEFVDLRFSPTLNIDSSWTLFLDRDGVINRRIVGGYVTKSEEFELLPGAVETIVTLSHTFGRLLIVTNQQGVGKGIMTMADVEAMHQLLAQRVNSSGGKIDAFYVAPQLKSENHPDRKPGPGMALKAQRDFPAIDFQKSLMVGDSPSDMAFGQNLGMKTAFVLTDEVAERPKADIYVRDLAELVNYLTNVRLWVNT